MKTQEIAYFLSAELIGDGDVEINGVAALASAGVGEIAFVEKTEGEVTSNASCLVVPLDHATDFAAVLLKVKNPKLAFARIAAILHPQPKHASMIHPSALVRDSARIADDVFIGPFVCVDENSTVESGTELRAGVIVGKNVSIGKNCVIHFNVVIKDNCSIGDNVILHSGVVIGSDGFGYVRDDDKLVKFPQIGRVIIENDVEIGANSCIDRGSLGVTVIGEGTKIDSLVQIAHNVRIGKRVIIAAQSGIAGSSTIGDDVVLAGQVGIADHVHIKSGTVIGAKSSVFPNKILKKGIYAGIPVRPMDDYKRQNAMINGLERTREELKTIKARLENLIKHRED